MKEMLLVHWLFFRSCVKEYMVLEKSRTVLSSTNWLVSLKEFRFGIGT
jgi:hypothetical protein